MLNNATGFQKVIIITGYTDLRNGIDGLSMMLEYQYQQNPFEENVLFLFCGHSAKKVKGLVWEGDGFLMLVKRLESGKYQWPRNRNEALQITKEQFSWLMSGFSVVPGIQRIDRKLTFS